VQVPASRMGLLKLMRKPDLPTPIANGIASLYKQVSKRKSTH
jgi:hypothetical protein